MQRRNTKKFDLVSISHFVRKKRDGHGVRHGRSEEQHLYFKSSNAWKRCRKHQDESGQNFAGILDRFQRDPVYRKSQDIGCTEAMQRNGREITRRSHIYVDKSRTSSIQNELEVCTEQCARKKSGPLASRLVFLTAVALKYHLYRESADYQSSIPPQDKDRFAEKTVKSQKLIVKVFELIKQLGGKIWSSSSSSSTWCQSD